MYIKKQIYFLKYIFYCFRDLFLFLFGGKQIRKYILKVPQYCRYKCDDVFICRNAEKEWKAKNPCNKIYYPQLE